MYAVVEHGRILNWANILADVMQKALRKYLEAPEGAKPPFYMSTYLSDMVLAMIEFPELKLKWGSTPTPVHELFSMLWVDNYIPHFYTICDKVMTRVYLILFVQTPPRISPEAAVTIRLVGHWFLEEYFTVIKIAGNEEADYLPWYVLDRLVLREIAHQTVGFGAFARLMKHGKRPWPQFSISVGRFTLANKQHALKEEHEILELQLCQAPHQFFDPYSEVRNIFLGFKLLCPKHMLDPIEEKFQDIPNYLEELRRDVAPETVKQARTLAINVRESLLQARDTLIKSLAANRVKAEEDRKKQRMERWERVVTVYKKKTESVPSTKPLLTSRKGDTSASVVSSFPTHEKLPRGDISKESLEKTRPIEEDTDPEGRLEK